MNANLISYPAHLERLRRIADDDRAHQLAVGGSFEAVGKLQYQLLLALGLTPASNVIDVGCGSGRLAVHLAQHTALRYLGTDIVPGLLDYARRITRRSDWKFILTDGAVIPASSDSADFVCFFSVLTHTKHEDSFRYLAEARSVLKPGGRIVFSFLEFERPTHWAVFETQLRDATPDDPLCQFMDRKAIEAWATHLGLKIENIFDGGIPHIPLDEDITWDDGRRQSGLGDIGHSVAVLSKA